MNDRSLTGRSKIEVARSVLVDYIEDLPTSVQMGLRAYGYDGSCEDESFLIYPVARINRAELVSAINDLSRNPDGLTPIAYSLSQIPNDLQNIGGAKEVLLVTDGEETCGGDPVAVAEQLVRDDPDLTIHVIGFEISSAQAQQNLRRIAQVSGGRYFAADTSADLLQALGVVARIPFNVFDEDQNLLGSGLANRTTVGLEDGTYWVDVPFLGVEGVEVAVSSGRGSSVNIDADDNIEVFENDPLCIAEFCPDVPLPRLVVGEGGRVNLDDPGVSRPRPVRVRTAPGLAGFEIYQLQIAEEFEVLDGPICNDGFLWWQVRNENIEGWSAEGVFGNYFLEPWRYNP